MRHPQAAEVLAARLQMPHPALLVQAVEEAGRKAPREPQPRRGRLEQAPAEEAAAPRRRRFRACWGRSGW
jgi:hypothetical protein